MSQAPADDPVVRELPASLTRAGFNAAGVLAPDRFDALVPEAWRIRHLLASARSVVVLGTGGPAFFRALQSARGQRPEPFASDPDNPVDVFAARAAAEACKEWEEAGWRTRALGYLHEQPGDGGYADFVALGRACGLGSPSRLGLLLHPRFGPWFAIRSMLVTERPLAPTPESAGAGPCEACPAPCSQACPVGAPAPGGFDTAACQSTRRELAGCALRCDARRACVVGPEHAYAAAAEAHHMRASLGFEGAIARPSAVPRGDGSKLR